jgi:large subunit ribosomal protein L15
MNLHQLVPVHKAKNKKRIGRGGKRGTYSGRGVKGQKARAGSRIRPGTRDLIQSIPKLRGARNMGARKRKSGVRRKDNLSHRNAQ